MDAVNLEEELIERTELGERTERTEPKVIDLMDIGSSTEEGLRQIESAMLSIKPEDQAECPLINLFAPGVLIRGITMPAEKYILGHKHKTAHFNIIIQGRVRVMIGGKVEELVAPCIFNSGAGVQKLLYIIEETKWLTVHANPEDETDFDKLEEMLVEKSDLWIEHRAGINALTQYQSDCIMTPEFQQLRSIRPAELQL